MSIPVQAITAEVADALATGRQISPIVGRHPGFGADEGYAVTAELRRLRQKRGERQIGRKIGFTNGLHGALLIGPRHPVHERNAAGWVHPLNSFEIALHRDGVLIDRGAAEVVLGGPLSALAHLVDLLARDSHNPPLRMGEVVTTGTVTRAFPIAPGQTWTTALSGIALDPLSVTFA